MIHDPTSKIMDDFINTEHQKTIGSQPYFKKKGRDNFGNIEYQ